MKSIPLGKKIKVITEYDPALLFSIPREIQRKKNKITADFKGFDIWNIYELSWLNLNGKPECRILQMIYSCDSQNIVESKSLKLYLYSFSMTKFINEADVKKVIINDLKKVLNEEPIINLYNYNKKISYSKIPAGRLLDNNYIETNIYKPDISLLRKLKNNSKTIVRYSNLLKTNCPITNQPDWATIYIKYKSEYIIEDESLLKYIISFRTHNDFHENTCERIFQDIFTFINPYFLIIKCFYTRRGGIDINPIRFIGKKIKIPLNFHYWRQ